MRIGYARVSTDEPSLDLQLDALKKAGCKRSFTDKASATKADRPGLADALSQLRSGDVLVIWKLDRLGRTVKGLVELVADLQGRGVQFRSLTDGIDTTTPAGRFYFHIMASLAQMKRELLAERTRAGLAAARRAKPVGLSPRQVAWLRCEVDAAGAAGERVVLFQHNYPYQIWEDFSGPGIDDWREIVQTRRITAVFTGHTHYGQVANDGRNVFVTCRSIGDPEGGPPGYTVAHLQGEDLAVAYRTIEDTGPLLLITHPREKILAAGPRHVICRDDEICARAWSLAPLRAAEARIDGGVWFVLSGSSPGFCSHPLESARLTKGEHALEVRVTDALGKTASQRIEFVADPTGRYTAVPVIHPVVTKTAFC